MFSPGILQPMPPPSRLRRYIPGFSAAWRRTKALFAETILPFASRSRRKGELSQSAEKTSHEEDAMVGKKEEGKRGWGLRPGGGGTKTEVYLSRGWKRGTKGEWGGIRRNETEEGEEREEGSEPRDPSAKGSYYNKFVGGLRSGNNSELRVTLRMCLSLLLFKWEWKATSCAGCDLHLRRFFCFSSFRDAVFPCFCCERR